MPRGRGGLPEGGRMEDMEMVAFLESHGIPPFPTKEVILKGGITLQALLGWGDDDFRLFFELNSIPKGPQLILKHAVSMMSQARAGRGAGREGG